MLRYPQTHSHQPAMFSHRWQPFPSTGWVRFPVIMYGTCTTICWFKKRVFPITDTVSYYSAGARLFSAPRGGIPPPELSKFPPFKPTVGKTVPLRAPLTDRNSAVLSFRFIQPSFFALILCNVCHDTDWLLLVIWWTDFCPVNSSQSEMIMCGWQEADNPNINC